jgi:hypothetical protein
MDEIITSEDDEKLLRANLLKCYTKTLALAFRISKEHYRYLAEQIIALRKSAKRREWQPISTAPKDGTRIMLWLSGPIRSPKAVFGKGHSGFWITEGSGPANPTHWMPLPEPPKQP